MDPDKSTMFAAAALPACLRMPGPGPICIAAQALAGGPKAALRANAGVMLGYIVTLVPVETIRIRALRGLLTHLTTRLLSCGHVVIVARKAQKPLPDERIGLARQFP